MKELQQKIKAIKEKLKLYQDNIDISIDNYISISSEYINKFINLEDDKFIKESLMYFSPSILEEIAMAIAFGCIYKHLSENIPIKELENFNNIKEFLDMNKYYSGKDILPETSGLFVFEDQYTRIKDLPTIKENTKLSNKIETISHLLCTKVEVYEYILSYFNLIYVKEYVTYNPEHFYNRANLKEHKSPRAFKGHYPSSLKIDDKWFNLIAPETSKTNNLLLIEQADSERDFYMYVEDNINQELHKIDINGEIEDFKTSKTLFTDNELNKLKQFVQNNKDALINFFNGQYTNLDMFSEICKDVIQFVKEN